MVSRVKFVKNLIFLRLFIKIYLAIIQMKTENIKNKINCEKFDMKKLSIKELKHLKNQAETNEITAIPKLIERLNLKGAICTWDVLLHMAN